MVKTDAAYYLVFESRFTDLNDIYIVSDIVGYTFILEQNIDLFENLYKVVGLERTALDADIESYRNVPFYILKQANGTATYYIPSSLIVKEPDPNVLKYPMMGIAFNIGVIDDPTIIDTYKEIINDQLQARLGVNSDGMSNIVYGYEYMKISDYDAIVAARADNITSVVNMTTELNRKEAEITRLTGEVAHLKQLVKELLP